MIPNTSFDPPAPFVTVQISSVGRSASSVTVDGLLDTGADVSLIPQRLVTELNLAPEDALIIEGYDGERQQLPLFAIDVVIENIAIIGIEIVAYPTQNAILGRDILNRFRLLHDGPSQMLEFL